MKLKDFMVNWYPIVIAFVCLLYSVSLGVLGHTEEAQYSAHWPSTILLFAIAIRQRRNDYFRKKAAQRRYHNRRKKKS